MANIPTFIQNKFSGTFDVLHPDMRPILQSTYGILVYQEQIQQLAQALAGYSLGEADILRKAVGKKQPEVLQEQRDIFVPRAVTHGVAKADADAIYDLIVEFANYGFNKSHAALR